MISLFLFPLEKKKNYRMWIEIQGVYEYAIVIFFFPHSKKSE